MFTITNSIFKHKAGKIDIQYIYKFHINKILQKIIFISSDLSNFIINNDFYCQK